MDITPIEGTSQMQPGLAMLARLFSCRPHDAPRELEHPAKPNINAPRRVGEQHLGPNQLKWLEERFKFYGIHRKQAEAPVGVAVVQAGSVAPSGLEQ